ncbi:MAG: alpha/beta hydrolase [Candidatus Micrarchaeota archaeon]
MKYAFIIHGSGGNPEKHWYPWLKSKLEEKGMQVFAPQFPIEEKQTLQNWMETLKPFEQYLEDSIMIGHSLGVPFILNILNSENVKINSAFLVSGFVGHLDVEGEENIDDFSERKFDWNKIKENCKKFYIFHSDNDSHIPLQKAQEFASNLGENIILLKGGEHFQAQSGFEKFDLLLKKIEERIEID